MIGPDLEAIGVNLDVGRLCKKEPMVNRLQKKREEYPFKYKIGGRDSYPLRLE